MSKQNRSFNKLVFLFGLLGLVLIACEYPQRKEDGSYAKKVQDFLNQYTNNFQKVFVPYQQEQLKDVNANGDSLKLAKAQLAYEQFVGDVDLIRDASTHLKHIRELTPIQIKQLQEIVYTGARFHQSESGELTIKKRAISQINKLNTTAPIRIGNRYYAVSLLDSIFSNTQSERFKSILWNEKRKLFQGKGKAIQELVNANNHVVGALGYGNYFEYKAGGYQMSSQELMKLEQDFLESLRPLMAELHTYLRYELAARYKQPVPQLIPAHWLASFDGSAWEKLFSSPYQELNDFLEGMSPSKIQGYAENYFEDLGYPRLSSRDYVYQTKVSTRAETFLMGNGTVKVCFAPATHLSGYEDMLHVFAKANYYNMFVNDDVPLLLQKTLSQGFLKAYTADALHNGRLSLYEKLVETDSLDSLAGQQSLLFYDAFRYIPKLVYFLGVLQQFEFSLYANNLELEQYNYKWWELNERFMGIASPQQIDESFCDPLMTKLHQNMNASSMDEALGVPMMFQVRERLNQLPDSVQEFQFMQQFLYAGASYELKKFYEEHFGASLSSQALIRYFEQVYLRLREINQGRRNTLPKWN